MNHPPAGDPADATVTIEKLMSLSAREFEKSLAEFFGRPVASGVLRDEEDLGQGRVEISYEPQAGVRLGGLLELPRAIVRIAFKNVDAEEREGYLRRFDIAFQRGGG